MLKAGDPIVTEREITEMDDNGYLSNRRLHLNYYAVKGLQARVYMWMGRYSQALRLFFSILAFLLFINKSAHFTKL